MEFRRKANPTTPQPLERKERSFSSPKMGNGSSAFPPGYTSGKSMR